MFSYCQAGLYFFLSLSANAPKKKATPLWRLECTVVGLLSTDARLALEKSYFFVFSRLAQTDPKKKHLSIPRYILFWAGNATSLTNKKSDIQGKMSSEAYRRPTIKINQNVGNVTDSYNVRLFAKIPYPQTYYNFGSLDEESYGLKWVCGLW